MLTAVQWTIVACGLFLVFGTLLNLSGHPHWFIRGWDFPRMQTAVIAGVLLLCYAVFFSQWSWYDWLFLAALAGCITLQCYRIYPYTPLAGKMVRAVGSGDRNRRVRLLISNVLMENEQHELLLERVREHEPDIFFAVEVNKRWVEGLQPLEKEFPYVVKQPQENNYGMAIYSRLQLIDPCIRFIVQDDVPSLHTRVELRCGQQVLFHGLHPRPPEPLRDQDAKPRDAELVVVGREIEHEDLPIIVAGDLNDVAWSYTTALFLRISQLLDPRIGRGLYNTFSAQSYFWRFPLDHIFHSECFQLVDLRVLRSIGSDHFPVLVELEHCPQAVAEQDPPPKQPADDEEAQEKVEQQEAQSRRVVQSPARRLAII